MFKHILVPTDGSKLSEKALRQAMAFARQISARVTALHVMPKAAASRAQPQVGRLARGAGERTRADDANRFLRFAQRLANSAGVQCDVAEACGDQPYKEIIKAAGREGCDLIMMASHGRRGIESLLLGSQTQKVLSHSRTPVLVYR
jgi:nucleotide-binding universal stress UspA family protein